MYYQINVSKKNKNDGYDHYFATDKGSLTTTKQVVKMLLDFQKRFPRPEFNYVLIYYPETSEILNINNFLIENGVTSQETEPLFSVNSDIDLTKENIDDLMCTAMEGGINYWCKKAVIKSIPEGVELPEFSSEALSLNAVITLYDAESSDKWELTLEKFLKGVNRYCEENHIIDATDLINGHDAETADTIIQYAIFDELTFN